MAKKTNKKPAAKAKTPVKAVAKKAATKKPAKKAVAKKAAPKKVTKAPAKKVVAKKAAPKKTVKKVAPKKVAKAPVKKVVAKAAPKKPVKPVAKPVASKAVSKKPAPKPVVVAKPAAAPAKKPVVVSKAAPVSKPVEEKKPAPKAIPFAEKKEEVMEIVNESSKRYSDRDLVEFKELINQKLTLAREELANLINQMQNPSMNAGDDSDNSYKTLEDGSSTAEKEYVSQLASRQKKFIENLEMALIRIENKTYGICRVTGKLISKERLRAVPHTTLSMEAKLQQYK